MSSKLLLTIIPFACSAFYLTYRNLELSRKVQCQTTPYLQDKSLALPSKVQDNLDKYIVYHECARKNVPTASVGKNSDSEMLTLLLRHTMTMFSRRPPAWSIWFLIKDTRDRQTFDPAYIRSLKFEVGDRVCGVYVVNSRSAKRISLTLSAPESYAGPLVEGILVVEIEEKHDTATFANHTVMWREKGKGSAGILESAFGRWMHGFMVKGLVESGVQNVLVELDNKKGL